MPIITFFYQPCPSQLKLPPFDPPYFEVAPEVNSSSVKTLQAHALEPFHSRSAPGCFYVEGS